MLNTSFLNKTQLKIKKIDFILFYWVGPGPAMNSGEWINSLSTI
jgi:hypothetical protein